jgi:hypothetical protein
MIVTDNCFTSAKFEDFLNSNGVKHVKIATDSSQANGQVEKTGG